MSNPENITYDDDLGLYVDSESGKMYYDQEGYEEYDPSRD